MYGCTGKLNILRKYKINRINLKLSAVISHNTTLICYIHGLIENYNLYTLQVSFFFVSLLGIAFFKY